MRSRRPILALLILSLALAGWTAFHLDLVDSLPEEDEVLTTAPEAVWLEFSASPDMSRTSFSIRGPDGVVELGAIERGDKDEVVRAQVLDEMPDGAYTLSWVGAPLDDHTVRGRFEFTVSSAQ